MTHEQKPESAEFRSQKWDGLPENQANDGWHWLTHEITNSPTPYLWKASSNVWIGDSGLQFYPNSAWCARRQYIGRARAPAEEMAEQRRKDAEGTEPVARGIGHWTDGTPMFESWGATKPLALGAFVYDRSANVAALIAEAIAAEREKIASKLDEVAKHLAHPWGAHLTEEGIAVKEACAARIEQEAAAIREGGEHD